MREFAVVFSPEALGDLESIRAHIAEAASPLIADNFLEGLIRCCEGLRHAPHRGTVRNEIKQGLRIIGWRRTITIAFAVDDAALRVDVAGLFYRGRDVAAAITERA
jgi:toxin ParE1/3/4